jgi:hypothetical protein
MINVILLLLLCCCVLLVDIVIFIFGVRLLLVFVLKNDDISLYQCI